MALNFFKKKEVLDLRKKTIPVPKAMQSNQSSSSDLIVPAPSQTSNNTSQSSSGGFFNFFGSNDSSSNQNTTSSSYSTYDNASLVKSEAEKSVERLGEKINDVLDRISRLNDRI